MAKDLFHAPEFLELIDWNDIMSGLCSHAHLNLTKNNFRSKNAFLDQSQIEFELNRQDILHNYQNASSKLFSQICRLPEEFEGNIGKDLERGRVPTIEQLHVIALLFESDSFWSEYFLTELDELEKSLLRAPVLFNKKIHRQLRDFINDDGSINERGFLELRLISEELLKIESEARKKAQELKRASNSPYGEAGEFDIINDRYVLPVATDHYHSNCGPIIHRSRTGLTLLVEPPQMKPYSLRRAELLNQRDWVVFKKCKEMGELLEPFSSTLDEWSLFAIEFDRLYTLAKWARVNNFSRPIISKTMNLKLEGLFHPLVEDCKANDVSMNSDYSGIILSGPNTGGKTVLLKSVAISVAMLRLGAWLPCKKAEVFPYSQLYFFSHDLQDIGAGLSSFSSEVKNYSALVEEISTDALVIIDEIFNSTSSEEASALAVSLLEYLKEIAQPHILLSTHHHGIKTTASTMNNFHSCHMAVDTHGRPLYQLFWGSPGSSRGIDTFIRLTGEYSWGKKIGSRAKSILGSNIFDYESALSDINAQRAEYLLMQNEAEKQILELKKERDAFNLQKETQLRLQQEELYRRYESLVKDAQREIDSLKKGDSSSRKVLDTLSAGKRELNPKSSDKARKPDNLHSLPKDASGLRVWSATLSKSGVVLQDKQHKLLVDFKGLRSWVKRDDLQSLSPGDQNKGHAISVHVQKEVIGATSVDGRGKRLEEFQSIALIALQELLNGDIPFLDIIHGHGDGILKKWLRQHLKHDQDFEWNPLDGNDGATRVQLKK